MNLDRAVLDWLVAHRTPWATTAFEIITIFGAVLPQTLATAVLALVLVARGRRRPAVTVLLAMSTGFAAMSLIKVLVARDRPPFPARLVIERTHSFPSGHAMLSATLATLGIVLVRRARLVWAGYALMEGVSRIYLAAHWTTDVLAGWCFGVLWALLVVRLLRVRPGLEDPDELTLRPKPP